jgi:hypothetical protein
MEDFYCILSTKTQFLFYLLFAILTYIYATLSSSSTSFYKKDSTSSYEADFKFWV